MLLVRRYLVMAALFFWQGGFLFYAAIVVPAGQSVLGSHLRQGFITQRVTGYLNLSGLVALLPLAWELTATTDRAHWRRRGRLVLWLAMLLCLPVLAWLHGRLDALMTRRGYILHDPELFQPLHRWYLWISTAQWVAAVAYLGLTLAAWRDEDQSRHRATEKFTDSSAPVQASS